MEIHTLNGQNTQNSITGNYHLTLMFHSGIPGTRKVEELALYDKYKAIFLPEAASV